MTLSGIGSAIAKATASAVAKKSDEKADPPAPAEAPATEQARAGAANQADKPKEEPEKGADQSSNQESDQPPAPSPSSEKPKAGVDERSDEEQVDAVLDRLSDSETGRALVEHARDEDLRIEFSDKPDAIGAAAAYYGDSIQISKDYRGVPTDELAGLLAHELAHFAVDQYEVTEDLEDLPDETEHLADEIISEGLAVTITKEAGIERTDTGVANADGSLRSFEDAVEELTESEFYTKHYGIDADSLTDEDMELIRESTAYHGAALINRYGSPHEELIDGVAEEDPLDKDDGFGVDDAAEAAVRILVPVSNFFL